jgi:hypothetical protein
MLEQSAASSKRVFLFSPEQIDVFWGNILHLLADCPGYYDFFTPEWTYTRTKCGDMQIWGCTDGEEVQAIVVTQIVTFPAQRAFEILGAAGSGLLSYFNQMEDVFDHIARDADCQCIMARMRPGMARLLRKKGVLQHAIFAYRPVANRRPH